MHSGDVIREVCFRSLWAERPALPAKFAVSDDGRFAAQAIPFVAAGEFHF
jgi:hypothetical protein